MADYAVVGFKGAGKGLHAVSKIQDAVNSGRRVATNLDIYIEHLVSDPDNRTPIVRLPDYPRFEDLENLGFGYEQDDSGKIDETKFGIIVLDEISIWMNARKWNDKDRLKLISWLRQARKFRWNVYYLAQAEDSVDNQTRELFEHVVQCKRTDRGFIPLVGRFLNVFNDKWGRFPKMHRALVTYKGVKTVVDTWVLQGILLKSIYKSYDTEQVFLPDELINSSGQVIDMRCSYSILPAFYINQWYMTKKSISEVTKIESTEPKRKPFWVKRTVLFTLLISMFLWGYSSWSSDQMAGKSTLIEESPSQPITSIPSHVIGSYISGTVKEMKKGIIYYSYIFYSSSDKTFYPEDYNYRIIPVSMCHAVIKGTNFSYDVTCGGRHPVEEQNSQLASSKVFNISGINPFSKQ